MSVSLAKRVRCPIDPICGEDPSPFIPVSRVVNYAYLEWKDLAGGCAVWICPDKRRKEVFLAQLRRRKITLQRTCAVICLNLEEPWSLIEQVKRSIFRMKKFDGLIELFEQSR